MINDIDENVYSVEIELIILNLFIIVHIDGFFMVILIRYVIN